MAAAPNADQIAYWNGESGERWSTRAAITERVFAPLTRGLLAAAGAEPGARIVEIGCGCGGTSMALARAVGPEGRVLGVDISRPMLAVARNRAAREAVANVDFVEADASTHPFEPSAFTLAVSQFGVMFFDDPGAAFANVRRALERGRLAFMCWRPIEANAWQTLPSRAVDPILPPATPAAVLGPGPFAFADPERIRGFLGAAGFRNVAIAPHDAELPLGDDPLDAAKVAAGFGVVARRLAGLPPATFARALEAIAEALRAVTRSDGVYLSAATWVVTAES